MFGDILHNFVDLTVVEEMRVSFVKRLDYQVTSGVPRPTAIKRLGVQFIREAWPIVRSSERTNGAFCYQHGCVCDPKDFTGKLQVNVAGVTCYDWSLLGNQLGWLGKSSIVFMARLQGEMFHHQRDIILAECVEGFDDDVFGELVSDHYSLTTWTLSPVMFGFPATRQRKYMVLLRKTSVRWMPQIEDPVALFSHLFHRPTVLQGNAFWNAPGTFIDRHHREWAKARHLPATQADGQRWPSKLLLSKETRQRIRQWEMILGFTLA